MSMMTSLQRRTQTAKVPEIDGRSAARQFLEEHDQIKHDLQAAIDETAALKEQLVQTTNMLQLMTREGDALKAARLKETDRANMWLGFCMKLIGGLEAIRATIGTVQSLAQEAAREAQAHGVLVETEPKEGLDAAPSAPEVKIDSVLERMPSRTQPPTNRMG